MTVRELKDILEYYEDDMEVVTNGQNSGGYVNSISNINSKTIRAFYGKDFQAVVLDGSQVGMKD